MTTTNEALDICFASFDLQTLGRASTCSTSCKTLGRVIAKQNLHILLPQALTQWPCTCSYRPLNAVQWLVDCCAGPEAVGALSASLVMISDVSLECCQALVAAGARISWDQLVAAARSGVAGVEVWVAAQQQLRIASDVPDAVTDMYTPGGCGHFSSLRTHLEQLQPRELESILIVAVNMKQETRARALLHYITQNFYSTYHALSLQQQQHLQAAVQQLQPAVVHHILNTALQRRHSTVFKWFEDTPGVALFTPAMVAAKIRQAIQNAEGQYDNLIILDSKAAQRLDAEEMTALLEAAMQRQQPYLFQRLTKAFGTAAIATARLTKWLQAAVQQGDSETVGALCSMQAAQRVDAAVVLGLFDQAMQRQDIVTAHSLLKLLVAQQQQQLDAGRLASFFTAAVAQDNWKAVQYICLLPAAQQQLQMATAVSSLKVAIQGQPLKGTVYIQPTDSCVASICCLSAIKQLQPASVTDFLMQAVKCGNTNAVWYLSQLPAVQQASSDHWADVLEAVLATNQDVLHGGSFKLLRAAAGRALTAAALEALLHSTLQQPCSRSNRTFKWLLGLAAAQQLGSAAIARLINTGVQLANFQAVQLLCSQPAAREVEAEQLAQLLAAAVKCTQEGTPTTAVRGPRTMMVGELVRLPAAAQLEEAAVLRLLQLAVEEGQTVSVVQELTRLKAARCIDAAAVGQLIHTAQQQGASKVVSFLRRAWQ